GVGILVAGHHGVSITNGAIRRFAAGVQVNSSTGVVIAHNEFADNGEAIDLQIGSVADVIKDNLFTGSTIRAIMLRTGATGNDIKDNMFGGNRIGILVFGGVDNT